jgi:hypothetical protein
LHIVAKTPRIEAINETKNCMSIVCVPGLARLAKGKPLKSGAKTQAPCREHVERREKG